MSNETADKGLVLPFGEDASDIIASALMEDTDKGDITSHLIIPEATEGEALFVAGQEMVVCGSFIPGLVYSQLDASVRAQSKVQEGQHIAKGQTIAKARGPARALLAGERVALNLMQHMSGVATLTRQYVDAVTGTKAIILDTRKTIPGLRILDKYAVRTGGGQNHRMGLHDMVLIKDNHIALCGSISKAVRKARAGTNLPVEIECDTLAQLEEALSVKPDRILLDNMPVAMLRDAVKIAGGKIPLEASGGISLENVRAVAETGIDYISIGRLTHSAAAADISASITMR